MADQILKTCSHCREGKPVHDFYKSSTAPDGFRRDCKSCSKSRSNAYVKANKEEVQKKTAEWKSRNRSKLAEYAREYYRNNSEVLRPQLVKKNEERRLLNPERQKEYQRRYFERNRELVLKKGRDYSASNPAIRSAQRSAWAKSNSHKGRMYAADRRALKLKATPEWANSFLIEEAYHLAKLRTQLTGIEWHVDHFYPLNSPLVCGLHHEANLRVIPAIDNLKKGNRLSQLTE